MNKYLLTILTFFIIANGWSYHFFTRGLNENNQVIGLEYENESKTGFSCAHYYNSFRDYSNTCAVVFKWHQSESMTRLLRVGFVTGYVDRTIPYILPGMDFKYEKVHLEISGLPNVAIFLIKWEF